MGYNTRELKASPDPKAPAKPKDVIVDPKGQWKHPGKVTKIPGDTMATHGYGDIPLWVVPDVGPPRMVQPNTGIQVFPGANSFTEYPQLKGWLDTMQDGGATSLRAVPTYASEKEQNKYTPYQRMVLQARANNQADREYNTVTGFVNLASHVPGPSQLPLAGLSSAVDFTEDNYAKSLLGLVPYKPFKIADAAGDVKDMYEQKKGGSVNGGWLDEMQEGGTKPWGEMTPKERAAYLDAKEANKKAETKSRAQAKKEHINDYIINSTKEALTHPIFSAPAYLTPQGAMIGAGQSVINASKNIYEGNYKTAVFDALGVLPLLKQLKNIPKSIRPDKFKSEIDWKAWNKEIPDNKALIKEYNTIESTSKANGSWMKNPNGSKFEGTPEQFVQQKSENFKKAFPEGYETTYRGSQTFNPHLTTVRGNQNDPIIFGTANKSVAERYATNSGYNLNDEFQELGKRVDYHHPDKAVMSTYTGERKDINPGLFEIGVGKDLKKIHTNGSNEAWYNLKNDDVLNWTKANGKHAERFNEWNKGSGFLEGRVKTDDIASYMKEKNIPIGKVSNVDDGADYFGNKVLSDVTMINPSVAKVKSLRYNNGMFDMTNPNIYKALIPAIAGSATLQEEQDGGWLDDEEFRRGGQKGLKKFTSKNIATSVNDIMMRNETLFGERGRKIYHPDAKGWLDKYK